MKREFCCVLSKLCCSAFFLFFNYFFKKKTVPRLPGLGVRIICLLVGGLKSQQHASVSQD